MNSEVYAVIEYGGEYEDKWEHIVGICSTFEVANELKNKVEEIHNPVSTISMEEWEDMMDRLCEAEEDGFQYEDLASGLKALFPEYSEEELRNAVNKYDYYRSWCGVKIQEVDFYHELPNTIDTWS